MRWLALLLGLACAVAQAEMVTGEVMRVIDGDTVTLRAPQGELRVRLAQIDAPELGQPYGLKARDALAGMILGRRVIADCSDVDRYGRAICALQADGQDVSAAMVCDGYTWVFGRYAANRSLYSLQEAARRRGLGLWADPGPVAPWDWRKGAR